ncbi:MAG: hypothetical protein ACE148_03780 [Vicinamibacterales bacterium]
MIRLDVESEIDRLYQLPLAEFTSARNELAKTIGGTKGAEIRALRRPSTSAWVVNQLYWRNRATYDALTATASRLREAQEAALGGRAAELRETDRAHDRAIRAALDAAMALVGESMHPLSAATRDAVRRTLRALPTQRRPGRLEKDLAPGAFETLARTGFDAGQPPLAHAGRPWPSAAPESRRGAARKSPPTDRRGDSSEGSRPPEHRREEIFEATRALREAERQARRAETAAAEARGDLDRRVADEARAVEQLAEARARSAEARRTLSAAQASLKRLASATERARVTLERLRSGG